MTKLRTRIYIDGFNLYYGCLRQSPYKWLDILTLFERHILPTILYRSTPAAPAAEMELIPHCSIKYFTANILDRAAKNDDSVSSQMQYHNALKKHCRERLELVRGYYSLSPAKQAMISAGDPRRRPRDCDKVQVWKIEEKQSDVNLALQIYDDALQGDIDQVVLVTNDTDLVPAFAMIKKNCPNIVRGLVIPTRKSGQENAIKRMPNTSLDKLAHWVREAISDDELRKSQLPDVVNVAGYRKPSIKPHSWYARPDHLAKMLEIAKPAMQRKGKISIMSWARKENIYLGGQRPIDLIETDEGAAKVFAYIEKI